MHRSTLDRSVLSALIFAAACSANTESLGEHATLDDELALSSSEDALRPKRSALLRVTELRTLSASEVITALTDVQFDASAVEHGVTLSRIVYRTPDAHGRPSAASALVAVPDGEARQWPLVAYEHGAIVFRGDAPSVSADPLMSAPALRFAGSGFVAVLPDYLGLGEGPGQHPFLHVPSEASASLDAIRATRSLLARAGKTLEAGVYVTGFSQGATAAFGLAHALNRDRELSLAALAPISGAHEWSRWVRDAANGVIAPKFSTVVLGYMSVAWNRVRPLYAHAHDFFLPPYDATVEALYDNTRPTPEVLAGTPDTPGQLFTADAFAQLSSRPRGALARALREVDRACADVSAPVLLLAARGDQSVAFSHSEHCLAQLEREGSDVSLTDLGAVDHDPSNVIGTQHALRFFQGLR